MIRAFIIFILFFSHSIAFACSICHCGDPTIISNFGSSYGGNLAGSMDSRWAIALEGKTQSAKSGDECHRQSEIALSVWHSFGSRFYGFVRLPYTQNRLSSAEEGAHSVGGIGDAIVMAGYKPLVEIGGFTPTISAGVKLPTGDNDKTEEVAVETFHRGYDNLDHDTEPNRDEHAQLGTGTTDGIAMLTWTRVGMTQWMISMGARFNGENKYDYHYGNVVWVDGAAYRNLFTNFSAGAGLRFRNAGYDTDSGSNVQDSGGAMISAILDISYGLTTNLNLRANVSIPIINQLNGSQSEGPVFIFGIASML